MSYFLENFINDACHTFLLNSIPESSIFWYSPQILELCCLSPLGCCGSLVLVQVWFVKEICVYTLFSFRHNILKMFIIKSCHFFLLKTVSWFIPSLGQASTSHTMRFNNATESLCHQVTLNSISGCWGGLWKWPLRPLWPLPGPRPGYTLLYPWPLRPETFHTKSNLSKRIGPMCA